jgi:1-phosphatidylinositol-4-phosphate 5-kinase
VAGNAVVPAERTSSIPGSPLRRRGSDDPVNRPVSNYESSPVHSIDPSVLKRESMSRKRAEEKMAMGTKVAEGHANYVLMYDMLTGLRISVSRCVAKPHRDLEPGDFWAKHKLTFDILGNELTPSSRYDFKFKDYAPWVFRYIREQFKIEAADYLVKFAMVNHSSFYRCL